VNTEGLEQGGYKLAYTEKPSDYLKASFAQRGSGREFWFSLGLAFDNDGVNISDVRVGSAADKAKLIPGEKVIAVNGRVYSKDAMHAAIRQAKSTSALIHLILQNESLVTEADVDYRDGDRYPALERIEGTPDLLADIAKPLAHTVGASN
ncbi:MAG TPA: hypothetical protein VJQ54_09540, partial [Candidatus Sulfotelmatobacter sp.]|nr:hypothetical protein [Candidatus Sulfotelmatobacter sp.]